MPSSIPNGLAYSEPFFYLDGTGYVHRKSIGKFVDEQLDYPSRSLDSLFKPISNFFVLSFNPQTYALEEKEIVGVFRQQNDSFYELTFDDNSHICLTGNTIVFCFDNCQFKLISAEKLKEGDFLSLSNNILKPKKEMKFLNIYDYNPERMVNLSKILKKHKHHIPEIKELLRDKYRDNRGYKINNILKENKNRGLSKNKMDEVLKLLNLELESVWQDIKLVSRKGTDTVSPLIPITEDFLIFAGLYLAEGWCGKCYISISNSNDVLQQHCKNFFESLGLNYCYSDNKDIHYYSTLFVNFFKTHGKASYKKHIPDFYYNLSNNQLRPFLRSLFDGDGWVESGGICYLSASPELVFNIKDLLLRFKITSRIRIKRMLYTNPKGEKIRKQFYVLSITGKDNLISFKDKISFLLEYKKQALEKKIRPKGNTNVDLIPHCSKYIKKLRIEKSLTQKELADFIGCSCSHISMIEREKRFPSKKIFRKILNFVDNNSALLNILKFNFRKIVKIREVNQEKSFSYMVKVKENKNFAAGWGNVFVKTD
ncbi:MAG: LAGLIDADG family homing endonuclease [Candidatus Heimdallarchaeaceae archaeon]